MRQKHGFEAEALGRLLAEAQSKPGILQAIAKPAERTLGWDEYRPRFVMERRLARGAEVHSQRQAELARAHAASGVPTDIMLGIVGVETFYGENVGKHRVLAILSLTVLLLGLPACVLGAGLGLALRHGVLTIQGNVLPAAETKTSQKPPHSEMAV